MKVKIINLISLIVLLYLLFLSVKFVLEPSLVAFVKSELEEYVKSGIRTSNVECSWLGRKIEAYNVSFTTSNDTATIKKCTLKFDLRDIFNYKLIISSIEFDKPFWKIEKKNNKFNFFPDFIKESRHTSKWRINVEKLIFKDFRVDFIDYDVETPVKFELFGDRLIVLLDFFNEQVCVKGILHENANKKSEIYVDWKTAFKDYKYNFSLVLSGNNIDCTRLNQHHYKYSRLKVRKGIGSFYLSLSNNLGVLNGYAYMKIKKLRFEAFNDSIFSTILGLSSKSFVNVLKENKDKLELDLLIYGTNNHPDVKLGTFSKNFILKAPLKVATGTLNVVEKTLNTVLFGIPEKIFNAGKSIVTDENKDSEEVDLAAQEELINANSESKNDGDSGI